jgi:hypothetical protein
VRRSGTRSLLITGTTIAVFGVPALPEHRYPRFAAPE